MGKLIFITGGVRSGKSGFAEQYVSELATANNRTPIYMATGVAFDLEMEDRIRRHKADRTATSLPWQTIEVLYSIETYATSWNDSHIILFECVTTWLSNLFYETESLTATEKQIAHFHTIATFKQTILNWRENGVTVLLISNEVLDDGLSFYAETVLYQKTLGELHQWLVKASDEAYEVNAQIIERWK